MPSTGPSTNAIGANTATVVNVDASADQHAIDPAVYGVAYATPAQLQDLRVTAHRRGGNNTSRHYLTEESGASWTLAGTIPVTMYGVAAMPDDP